MRKISLLNLIVLGFCLGWFVCYLIIKHETKSNISKATKIIHYSRQSGSFDPYSSNILLIKNNLFFEKSLLINNSESILKLIPDSEFKPKLIFLMYDSVDYKVLCYPNNLNYPSFFENSYLLTKDSIYQLTFKPIELLRDTIIETRFDD